MIPSLLLRLRKLYYVNFKTNIDKFCEQYLNDTSTHFEEEKAFFCDELKCQYHKNFYVAHYGMSQSKE